MLERRIKEAINGLVHPAFEECPKQFKEDFARKSRELSLRGFNDPRSTLQVHHHACSNDVERRISIVWNAIERVVKTLDVQYSDTLEADLRRELEYYTPLSLWNLMDSYPRHADNKMIAEFRSDLLRKREHKLEMIYGELTLFVQSLRFKKPALRFNMDLIRSCLWVLESEDPPRQGTAFHLNNVGLVTCHHVLTARSQAFRAAEPRRKHPIEVVRMNADIDLAVIRIPGNLGPGLERGSAVDLKQMDTLAVAGFPNYRIGTTESIVTGYVTAFRQKSAIRRALTDAPIIAGCSGGPTIGANDKVIGVAVTGADRMEEAQDTEDHGIIPIDALEFLP